MEWLNDNFLSVIALLVSIYAAYLSRLRTINTPTKKDLFRDEIRKDIRDLKGLIFDINPSDYILNSNDESNIKKSAFIEIIHDKLHYNTDENRKKIFLTKKEINDIINLAEIIEDKFGEMTSGIIIEKQNKSKILKYKEEISKEIKNFLKNF